MIFSIASGVINLEATPFTDNGYAFRSLHMEELLGGNIATGSISFTSDGTNMKSITDEEEINIKLRQNDGVSYDIRGFIHRRSYLRNEVVIHFICASKEFMTKSRVMKYTDITDALSTLYTWNTNIAVKSDINNDLEIHQNGQSDYQLAAKLAQSYKYNTVFAFGLEGFMIKDVDSDPVCEIKGQASAYLTGSYELNYYKQMEIEPEVSETTDNLLAMMNDQSYYLVHESYSTLMENYLYNRRYFTDLYTSFKLRYILWMPRFKLGDRVVYHDEVNEIPWKNYIVSSMIYDIDFNKIEVNVILNGIDDYGK